MTKGTWVVALLWACCCGPLAARGDDMPPMGFERSATITGLTGLIRVPNAFVLSEQRARFTFTPPMGAGPVSIGARSSWSAMASMLPRTEMGFTLGPASQDYDLAAHGKVRVLDANGYMPAVAVGVVDVARNGPKGSTGFVVGTWPLLDNQVALTLGGAFSGNQGLLAGVQVRLGDVLELQAEYDTERVNYGAALTIGDRAVLRVANINQGTIATVGYQFPMTYLPVRTLTAPAKAPEDAAVGLAIEKIKDTLVGWGFEDVQVTAIHVGDNIELTAAYDDRCFTVNQLDSLPDVLRTMAENAPANTAALIAKIRRRSLVMAEYRIPLETYRRFASGQATPEELRDAADIAMIPATGEMRGPEQATAVENTSFGHVDVVLSPGLRTVLGTETGAFKIGVLGQAEVIAPLGRGLQAQARWTYPLGGELVIDEPRTPRVERSLISYAFSPRPRWLVQVIAGKFTQADGVVVEAVRPLNDLSLVRLIAGKLSYNRLDDRLYLLGEYWYFLPKWRTQIRVVGGRFLSADTGIGVDLIRSFGAVEVAVGVRETSASRLVQLTISMPLSPRKQPQAPSRVRVRLDDYVDHSMRSIIEGLNYLYLENVTARELTLGPDLRNTYLNRFRLAPGSGCWPGQ